MADITVHDVHQRLGGDAQLVDVREPDEFAAGTVPGARNIPLGSIGERMGEIDPARPVIAICRSGGRSAQATMLLSGAGYQVDNMLGGMLEWTASGLEVAV